MTNYSWPVNARSVVFVSVNFDAESFDLKETSPERLYGRFSYGRYGTRAGLPRLTALLQKHDIPATFFVPAADAKRHPNEIHALIKDGYEIAARGIDMEDFATLGDKEFQILKDSRDILSSITGHAPCGFRSPNGNLSSQTLHFLSELGFTYDATFQDADNPYVFELKKGQRLVEIPSSFALDDAPVYSARHTHARLISIWRDEFRAMHEEGMLIPLTLHLRGDFGSTRGARIAALDELLTDIKSHSDVHFMNGAAIAAHTRTLGLPGEPDPAAAHAQTLARTVFRGDLAVKPL